jgi:hypothetical protein
MTSTAPHRHANADDAPTTRASHDGTPTKLNVRNETAFDFDPDIVGIAAPPFRLEFTTSDGDRRPAAVAVSDVRLEP